ncbi:4'-phosphopantetheinyl transferase superfamily protein [Polaribacter sp.]|uniref:4'-phosphopantetheinyl transferase family protein n=1 Tax=Polaribacter sp. TaxID=1920175 RepID=UPI0025DD06D9|nr:4'-phosphopantetheinyl transferase superfamily protein [Polaribacter sp.]
MIGNDVVDLQLAKTQSNWQRKGFLEKQFSETEIRDIEKAQNSFELVWLFWSMKEAAYKCYIQTDKKRFFAPRKFNCFITSKNEGVVEYLGHKFKIQYQLTKEYIHSWVVKEGIVQKSFYIDNITKQSITTNQNLLNNFCTETFIRKDEFGVPYLFKENQKLLVFISTAHHGNYGAYVIFS